MFDTQITLTGWIGGDVTVRDAGGFPVAGFRVATTPRRFDKKTGLWVDGDTQWYSVSAWRQLGENCAASLRRGDPVVIHGRMSAHTWKNTAGIEVTAMEVEASFVGHDLNRGVSVFTRNPKAAPGAGDVSEGADADVADAATGAGGSSEAAA